MEVRSEVTRGLIEEDGQVAGLPCFCHFLIQIILLKKIILRKQLTNIIYSK